MDEWKTKQAAKEAEQSRLKAEQKAPAAPSY